MGSKTKTVSVGLIGLGRMGQNHLRVLSMLAGFDVAFVHDIDHAAGQRVAKDRGVAFRPDLGVALGEVDAVVIASPTTTHADFIIQAADHVRNIFVEKPVTQDLASARMIGSLVDDRGLRLQVGFIERFNPAVEQMKGLLDGSEQVVSVDFARTNKISSRITDVDVVTDLMIHDIDLAMYLNGPVTSVSAHGIAEDGMIDYAAALLTHGQGRFSRIQASRITDKKMRSIQATCRDMFVNCDLLRKEITLSRQTQEQQQAGGPYRITSVEETIEVQPKEALVLELQAFLEACRDTPAAGTPGISEGVAAMEVCDQVRTAILAPTFS